MENSASTEQILMEFYIRVFFENLSNLKFRCTLKINTQVWSYLSHFFLEREILQTKLVKKIKTHILWSIYFFRKSCRLWDNVVKYCRVKPATDGPCFFLFRAVSFLRAFSSVVRQIPGYNSHSKEGARPALFPISLTTLGSNPKRPSNQSC
jgi:hypothetical protein